MGFDFTIAPDRLEPVERLRSEIQRAFSDLVTSLRAPYLLVSFNDEGHLHTGAIERLLTQRGYVASVSLDFKRYVGAQIGIFNPEGERVGAVSHLRNREHLFLVGPSRKIVEFATSTVQGKAGVRQAWLHFPH